MMSDLKIPRSINLATRLREMVAAHAAISDGIMTHAEREHATRQAARAKMEIDQKLNAGAVTRGT